MHHHRRPKTNFFRPVEMKCLPRSPRFRWGTGSTTERTPARVIRHRRGIEPRPTCTPPTGIIYTQMAAETKKKGPNADPNRPSEFSKGPSADPNRPSELANGPSADPNRPSELALLRAAPAPRWSISKVSFCSSNTMYREERSLELLSPPASTGSCYTRIADALDRFARRA